jgi:hypothetical protein
VASENADCSFSYSRDIRVALFNERLNFRRQARVVIGYSISVASRRKTDALAGDFERFPHEGNFDPSKLVEPHGDHRPQGRFREIANTSDLRGGPRCSRAAGARTGRVLASGESQCLPAFTTVGNDNARAQLLVGHILPSMGRMPNSAGATNAIDR